MKLLNLRKSSLGAATLWNVGGAALPLLVGLFTIPPLMRGMGQEAFGLLTLVWAAIGYLSLFDFGLGRALTLSLAAARAQQAQIPRALLFTGAMSTLLPGLIGALLLHAMAEPLVVDWLNISPDLQSDTLRAFQLLAWSMPLVSLAAGLRGILEGYEAFKAAALLRMTLGVLNFLLPLSLVLAGFTDLLGLVWVLLAARLFSVLHNVYLLRTAYWSTVGKAWELQRLVQLLKQGGWMGLSNLLGPLMLNFDRFLVTALVSAQVVAYYTVPQDLLIRLLFLPMALATALFPRMTWLFTNGSLEESSALYQKALRLIGLSIGVMALVLAIIAKPALHHWLGLDYAEISSPIGWILLLGVWFNSLAMIPFAAIQARGGAKITSAFHGLELLLYIPLLYVAIQQYALLGAAWVWTGRMAFDFVLLHFYHQKNSSSVLAAP